MKHLIIQTPKYLQLQASFGEWLYTLGYAKTSVNAIPSHLREFFHYLESEAIYNVDNMEQDHLTGFFEALKHRPCRRTGNGLTNAYLNKYLQSLRLFSTYLRETQQSSFAIDMMEFKHERNIKAVLTQDEIQQLYGVTDNTPYGIRDKAMLSIYYGCGLRSNEGVQLDVSDILFDRKMIYVRKGKHYTERYVPASPKVLQDIGEYVRYARQSFIIEGREHHALFISQRGLRINGQSLSIRLRTLINNTGNEQLKTKNIGMHSLRHSIATHLLIGGMRLERIANFLGHKTIESTQIYTHLAHELQNTSSVARI